MANTLITLHAGSNNPFERARCTLIMALGRLRVPPPTMLFPDDFEAVRDHMLEVASMVDAWMRDIGHQVSDNATTTVDLTQFDDAFTGAIEGNATWELEKAAEALRDDAREMVS